MKILKCSSCDRSQKEGKFCLDCGQPMKEIITDNIQFKPIDTNRTSEQLKRDVRKWLNRIGVQNSDILINTSNGAEIEYYLNDNQYHFKSLLQRNTTNNLAAVEQFLHHRVLGIERGIETTEQAFKGYEALPDPKTRLTELSDKDLRNEIKLLHPDTGNGDKAGWELLMAEKERRKQQ